MRGWRLFTLSGIDVEINPSWLVIFVLLVLAMMTEMGHAAPGAPPWQSGIAGIVAALLLFASVLFHELAHSLAARHYGLGIARITLFIFGGVAQSKGEAKTGVAELVIAGIGPLSSVALAAVLIGLSYALRHLPLGPLPAAVAYRVGIINLYLAGFNLLPAFPLDGGRLLRASLWEWWGDLRRSTQVATALGRFFGTALMALGVYYAITSGLVNGLWFLALGWLLTQAARQSWQALQVREVLKVLTVAQALRPLPAALQSEANLQDAVEQFLTPYRLELMPVVSAGALVGILESAALSRWPREQWAGLTVGQAMTPWDPDTMLVPAAMDLGAAVEAMTGNERREVLVVNAEGLLVGLLTQGDVLAAAQRLTTPPR